MKLNQEQLKKILEDLYAVDENLRHYEKELVQIICDIVELKPEVKFDENFRLQLRAQLMERAVQLAQEKSVQPAGSLLSWKFSYVLAGALALAVLVFGGGYLAQKQGIIEFPKTSLLEQSEEPFAFKKLSVSDNAFGSLKGDQAVTQAASGVGGGGGARTESGGGDG